ncbi:hypothetical protein E2C05_20840 [Paracraurococcus ruber]|uniref:hypothetical protein n=1 Tax=Paracraurococcus ruber TaxID=77675 RepID=UPI00105782D7|nr:hypothetical protein [Paracraurococcus ruber]TDG28315.1 hypothetical protein E2C05_20840 [Paracraurococcus ruber]
MSDSPSERPEQLRLDPVLCPHCDEVTMPNQMADGSVVCSCTAERALPLDLLRDGAGNGAAGSLPPPVDAMAGRAGAPSPGLPPGDSQGAEAPRRGALPADRGQFGRDIGTEDYEPLRPPPREG